MLIYRACVGRNVAVVELQIVIASLLRRYQFVLEQPGQTVSSAREVKTFVPNLSWTARDTRWIPKTLVRLYAWN